MGYRSVYLTLWDTAVFTLHYGIPHCLHKIMGYRGVYITLWDTAVFI